MNNRLSYRKHARTQAQLERMKKAEKENKCPFCPAGLKEIHKEPIIFETDLLFITRNPFPYTGAVAQFIIAPKDHITDIEEFTEQHWQEMGVIMIKVKQSGVNYGAIFMRFGDMSRTGASLKHLHFQLLQGNSSKDKGGQALRVKVGYFTDNI